MENAEILRTAPAVFAVGDKDHGAGISSQSHVGAGGRRSLLR